jgi:antitoxin VapB
LSSLRPWDLLVVYPQATGFYLEVAMSLNIKNPEVHELARELAELTGENMTEAIRIALKERLARERNTPDRVEERTRAILAMGAEIASRLPPEFLTMDVDDYLYDERGLPK